MNDLYDNVTKISEDINFLDFIGKQESQNIIPASEITDKVIAEINGLGNSAGDLLPWSKTHNSVHLRPGEVSVWGGYNGHGKSQILSQVCAWGLQTSTWLIASMEMPLPKLMKRMVRQISGTDHPSDEYAQRFLNWTHGRLWLYDQNDTVQHEKILGMVHYAAKELNIKHIVIDSLMKCGFKGSRDSISSQQVEFVDRLCWCAKSNDIHIHLVHHMRKGEGTKSEYVKPGKHDFRGAGEIVDLVDNAFIIHRNKKKEMLTECGEVCDEPDATLEVVKQRHGEEEPYFKFWFHKASQQYTPDERNIVLPYGQG